jgi:hypothetical protein
VFVQIAILHAQNIDAFDFERTAGSIDAHEFTMIGTADPFHDGHFIVFPKLPERLNRLITSTLLPA